jgi:hypothetical protein
MLWLSMVLAVVIGVILLSAIIVAAVLVAARSKRGGWTPPERTGPPTRVRAFTAQDGPLGPGAAWRGDELEIRADQAGPVRLFEVEIPGVDQCVLLYRFRIKTEALKAPVYAEMWCRVPSKGEFFSRGLDQKVRDAHDWRTIEIPFYLEERQTADLVKLNLVFEGPGAVRVREIEVLQAPVKPRLQPV